MEDWRVRASGRGEAQGGCDQSLDDRADAAEGDLGRGMLEILLMDWLVARGGFAPFVPVRRIICFPSPPFFLGVTTV